MQQACNKICKKKKKRICYVTEYVRIQLKKHKHVKHIHRKNDNRSALGLKMALMGTVSVRVMFFFLIKLESGVLLAIKGQR